MHTPSVLLALCLLVGTINAASFTTKWACLQSWNCFGYWEYLPNSYNTSTTTKHPTIVTLHGLGEYGNGTAPDINKLLATGMPNYINTGKWPATWDFIVIAPQDFNGWWNEDRAQRVLDYLQLHYAKMDLNRIYLTGYSAGGGGVWDFSGFNYTQPMRLAAIAPIAGSEGYNAPQVANMVATNLPVWGFHNLNDPTVSSGLTVTWINQLNAAHINPPAQITIYNVSGHDSWTATYNPATSPLYAWFLTHSRGAVVTSAPTNPPTIRPTTPPPTCPAATIGTGTGLLGVYYHGMSFNSSVGARIDSTVDLVYATGAGPSIPTIGFVTYSIRWTGSVQAKFSGAHTITTTSDDGIRVTFNGASIINNWSDHSAADNNATVSLVAGTKYPITVEYYQNTGGVNTVLQWSASCLTKEVIPATQLYPAALNIC